MQLSSLKSGDMVERYLEIKRQEYNYAVKHNLLTLQKIVLQSVKQATKKFNYKIKPNEQLELF